MTTGAIRIADPAALGPALRDLRLLLGLSRYDVARLVCAASGRSHIGVVNQLQQWETRTHLPTVRNLGPVLTALGYDLALIPRENS